MNLVSRLEVQLHGWVLLFIEIDAILKKYDGRGAFTEATGRTEVVLMMQIDVSLIHWHARYFLCVIPHRMKFQAWSGSVILSLCF